MTAAVAKGGLVLAGSAAIAAAMRASPFQHSELPPLALGGFEAMPAELCGVPLGKDPSRLDYRAEWLHQRDALAGAFGDSLDRPRVGAACARAWLALWLDVMSAAAKKDAAFALTAEPLHLIWLKQSWRQWDKANLDALRATDRTPLGDAVLAAHKALVDLSARPAEDGGVYLHARRIHDRTRQIAIELDRAGVRAIGSGARLKKTIADGVRGVAGTVGDTVAGGIEIAVGSILGPAIGASVGALVPVVGPYVLVGGIGYLAFRRAS